MAEMELILHARITILLLFVIIDNWKPMSNEEGWLGEKNGLVREAKGREREEPH